MLATFIIVFRELMEAGLIIGVMMAATKGIEKRGYWISCGIVAGLIGACVVALFADTINRAIHGIGQEIFNATILCVAVAMLAWHNIWIASHGKAMVAQAHLLAGQVKQGMQSLLAIAVVVCIAILREGAEVVLFLYSVILAGGSSAFSMVMAGMCGVAAGIAISALLYFGLLRIPARYIFNVTNWLVALLAAGMAAKAVFFLQQAGVLDIGIKTVWDSSAFLPENTTLGQVLHGLIGYTDRPSQLQLVVYGLTLLTIVSLSAWYKRFSKTTAKSI